MAMIRSPSKKKNNKSYTGGGAAVGNCSSISVGTSDQVDIYIYISNASKVEIFPGTFCSHLSVDYNNNNYYYYRICGIRQYRDQDLYTVIYTLQNTEATRTALIIGNPIRNHIRGQQIQ
jgi:hypothetical protein